MNPNWGFKISLGYFDTMSGPGNILALVVSGVDEDRVCRTRESNHVLSRSQTQQMLVEHKNSADIGSWYVVSAQLKPYIPSSLYFLE